MSNSQQFLYKIQPTRPEMLSEGATEAESAIVSQHFNYLKDLSERGVVLLAGRTLNADESSFGIVIFAAESEAAAQLIVDNDPAVSQGVMRAKLYPYRIALMAKDAFTNKI
ncbi:MAG: hypothetical protein GY803_03960 [Chloroflexi bacterium]|nr:hypothetical protein [Chloroflexota bacterium]